MTTFEIFQTLIGTGVIIGIAKILFMAGRTTQKIDAISSDLSEVKRDLNRIESRLSRLEGAFCERGYWESRKNGTEDKK